MLTLCEAASFSLTPCKPTAADSDRTSASPRSSVDHAVFTDDRRRYDVLIVGGISALAIYAPERNENLNLLAYPLAATRRIRPNRVALNDLERYLTLLRMMKTAAQAQRRCSTSE